MELFKINFDLQFVQNAAARDLTTSRKYEHITQFYHLYNGYLLNQF